MFFLVMSPYSCDFFLLSLYIYSIYYIYDGNRLLQYFMQKIKVVQGC